MDSCINLTHVCVVGMIHAGMHKSSWVVADAAPGTLALAAQQPVRIIGVTAGAELTRTISKLHQQQQTVTGLVSFENHKLGVKVCACC